MNHIKKIKGLIVGSLIIPATVMASMSPIIFIHGFKGSTLVNKKGSTVWLTPLQALGISSPSLALPTSHLGLPPNHEQIEAKSILEKISIIPGIFSVDLYGPWIQVAKSSNRHFFSFVYDWRQDLNETTKALEIFIEKVASQKKVLGVAHSMGGLILFSLLNRRPELFSGGVFAGSPLKGGIGFLPDLQAGTKNGLNGRILNPETLLTFPSVYSFFPKETNTLLDEHSQPQTIHFFEIKDWKKHQLGFYAPGRNISENTEAFFAKALKNSEAFKQTLLPKTQTYPPLLVVAAKNRPTLKAGKYKGPKAVLGWDFVSEPKDWGDGRVLTSSMMLPEEVPHQVIFTEKEHAEMLSDPYVQKTIFFMP